MRLLRFRSMEDCERADAVLTGVVALTTLPGGVLAVPDEQYESAAETLTAAEIDWRWEEVEGYISGRALEEERE